MSIINKPDMNYGVWAEGGNIEIPSSEKVEEGWVIEKPLNEQMNWLQNRQDRMLQYLNQRGVGEWDSRTEYPENAFVSRGDTVYQAVSQNIDSDPTTHQDIWKIAFVKYEDYITYRDKVDEILDEDGYVEHYVQKKNPIMEGEAKSPAYNSPDSLAGLFFESGIAKIRKGLKVVAEFSGGSNPKDVVTHEQLAIAIQTYKVGDIYITTQVEDPSERLGYGTWERFAQGRTLVGVSTDVSNDIPEWVKRGGTEFGEYDHTLTVEEMPRHSHGIGGYGGTSGGGGAAAGNDAGTIFDSRASGEDRPHNNVQPSIVVYFWKRVA